MDYSLADVTSPFLGGLAPYEAPIPQGTSGGTSGTSSGGSTITGLINLGSAWASDAINVLKATNSPSGTMFSGTYTPAQIAAMNAAATSSTGVSSTSGIFKWMLYAGIGILVVALLLSFRKKR